MGTVSPYIMLMICCYTELYNLLKISVVFKKALTTLAIGLKGTINSSKHEFMVVSSRAAQIPVLRLAI